MTYASGALNSTSVAVADLNHDGKLDIVVGNQCADNNHCQQGVVGVLLGNGDGSFQSAKTFNSGAFQANSVAVADMNDDGIPDVIVGNACEGLDSGDCESGTVAVLVGNGDGSFGPATIYASGGFDAISVALADVNRDGNPDVLVANADRGRNDATTSTVGVLLGNGDATVLGPRFYQAGTGMEQALASADVNGDGNPDLIVGYQCDVANNCATGAIAVLLGNGDGSFRLGGTYFSGGSYLLAIATADVNGDGKPDVVVANDCDKSSPCTSGAIGVLLGNGDGTFQTALSFPSGGSGPGSLVVSDVNVDGKPDVIVANSCGSNITCSSGGVVSVLLGNGDGTLQTALNYWSGGEDAASVAVMDVNGDGKQDLVVMNLSASITNLTTGVMGVLFGNGDGTFQTAVSYLSVQPETDWLAVRDMNGDGIPDIIAENECATDACISGSLTVLLGNGDGTFQTGVATNTPRTFGGTLILGDLNGDGKLDVASGTGGFLLLGNGDGTFQNVMTLGIQARGIATADFNHDGKPDLAIGGAAILLNVGPGFRSNTQITLGTSANPSAYNQKVTFTATVSAQGSGVPTGTVILKDATTILGTASLISGKATWSTALAVGAHSITASYSGDLSFLPSTSAVLTENVNKATTSTILGTSANPSYLNQRVTFTATVKSQYGGSVTGTVTFKQGTTVLGTVVLANGQAAYSTAYTTTGTRSITAVYSGDGNDLGSTSAVLYQAVNTLPAATTTKVITSGSPTYINHPVTFTATITSTYGPIPNGDTITFYDGTTVMGTGFTTNGASTLSTSILAARTHTIKAAYAGDATFKASSGTVTQVVNLYPSTASVPTSSLNPSIYGQAVTLRATVTSAAPSPPTGTVVFKNGTTWLASGTLSTTGVATATTRTLPAGSLSITATYNGDLETAKSTSAALSQTVTQTTSTATLKSSLNPSLSGQTVTFTAIVASPTITPTGTVTFMDGSTILGTGTLSGGKTTYSTATLSTGSHNISAIYSGTPNVKGSTSSTLLQIVN